MANMRIPENVSIDEPEVHTLTRREAVRNGAQLIAGAGIGAQVMAATGAETAIAQSRPRRRAEIVEQARLRPARQAHGRPMSLPDGFQVFRFGAAGSRMSDGLPTPKLPRRHHGLRRRHGTGSACCETRRDTTATARPLGKHNAYDRGRAGRRHHLAVRHPHRQARRAARWS